MIALVVVLVLATIAIVAGVGCVFMRIARREAPSPDARDMEHRAQKARIRAERDDYRDRWVSALAELARTQGENARLAAELVTLRRAWEHGIDFVTSGDRPVVEQHEEVA